MISNLELHCIRFSSNSDEYIRKYFRWKQTNKFSNMLKDISATGKIMFSIHVTLKNKYNPIC